MTTSVALLHYTAPPIVGGVERVVGAHARAFAEAGHPVRIIAGRGHSPGRGVVFIRIPLADSRGPVIDSLRAALEAGSIPATFDATVDELVDQLRAALEGADVLIAHNVCSIPKNRARTAAGHRIAAEPGGPRVVAWHHDVAAAMPRYAEALFPGEPWDLVRRAWPGVPIVAVSRSRAAAFRRVSGGAAERISVIPNGVDWAAMLGLTPTTARLVDELGLAEAAPILLVPARMTARKYIALAVRLLAAIRARGDDARLVLTGSLDPHDAGSAAHRREILALARELGVGDTVHVVAGRLGRSPTARQIVDLYRLADALLVPSTDEGFGLPILEAAAARLPVICTDIAPLRELAGADALYVEPDASPDELAARVLAYLKADPRHRLAARIRRTYDWRRIFEDRIRPLVEAVAAGHVP